MSAVRRPASNAIAEVKRNPAVDNATHSPTARKAAVIAATIYGAGLGSGVVGSSVNGAAPSAIGAAPVASVGSMPAVSATPGAVVGGYYANQKAEQYIPPVGEQPAAAPSESPMLPDEQAILADPVLAARRRKQQMQGRAGTMLTGGTYGTTNTLGDASGGNGLRLLGR